MLIHVPNSPLVSYRSDCFRRKNIPGEPGKDYPIYSIDILRKINPGMFGGARSAGKSGQAASPTSAPAQQVCMHGNLKFVSSNPARV
jgi:hypothetical protein